MVEDLGTSGVPYSPFMYDPSEKLPKYFTPSFFEWLFTRGQQITARGFSSTGSVTLYTVPNGYIFYLTSAFLNWQKASTGAGYTAGGIYISSGGSNNYLLETWTNYATFAGVVNASNSYPFPIQVPSGASIILLGGNSNDTRSAGNITGILIKKDQIPQF